MRALGLLAASTATLFLAAPARAWNATGHRIVAAIAYERLTPSARARVDQLLQHHPDYETHFLRDAPQDPAGRARAAFIAASVWPDEIKSDPRFYDDLRQEVPTPLLPGFPDMARHTNWHYYDTAFSPDGTPTKIQPPPNALTELRRLIEVMGTSPQPYDLPWLIHITGDVHQPLHCANRYLKTQPQGDAGGNNVFVTPGMNLHMLWDDAAGSDTSDAYVTKYAAEAVAGHPAPHSAETDPKKWLDEGFKVARKDVYTFGNETGSKLQPIPLPKGYLKHAATVAQVRIAIGGYRLAAVLNEKLR